MAGWEHGAVGVLGRPMGQWRSGWITDAWSRVLAQGRENSAWEVW